MHNLQAPSTVVMVRPHRFSVNPQTAADNHFQRADAGDADAVAHAAFAEATRAAETLRAAGVQVLLFDDDGSQDTPDSVFPNNWISTHAGGLVVLYPMHAENRRRERRSDITAQLLRQWRVQQVLDLSPLEQDGVALEGTGVIVFDHLLRLAWMARSRRASEAALARLCAVAGYEPLAFDTADARGQPIYHTNVMLAIGTDAVLVGTSLIAADQRSAVRARLAGGGRAVVDLSEAQINHFAGNALELAGSQGRVWAMSSTAHAALSAEQVALLERGGARVLALDVPTIERAGGSVRCMLAGVHLASR